MRYFTAHRVIVSLLCCLLCLTAGLTVAAQTQGPDEVAARDVVAKFFAAYQRRDLPGVLALWSARAPELASVKQTLQKTFSSNEQFELKSLDISKVTVEAERARVELKVEMSAVDVKTGRPASPDLGRGTRTLRLVKEEGVWKIWQYAPIEAELATALIAAKTEDERKALLAARAESVTPVLVRELNKQARAMLTPKTAGEFLPAFSLALSLAERLNDRAGLIESWRNIGNVHRVRGDAPQALEAFNKSLRLAEEAHDLEAVNAALNATAATYFMKGQHEQALVYLRRGIEVAKQRGDTEYIIHTLSNIGLVHKSQGKLTEAVADYRASLAVAEQAGNKASAAVVVNDLGNTYMLLSDYSQARAAYEQSLRLARAIGNKRSTGAALTNLGILAQTLGDYDQALDNFQQGLAIAEADGDKQATGTALSNIGNLYYARGDYARALEAYHRSLQLREEIKHRAGIASTLTNIGLIHKSQGNYALALDYLQRGLALKQELNDKPSIAFSLNTLGSLYHAQRDYVRALDYLQQSLKLHEALGDRSGLARALSHTGLTYYDRGDYTTALDYWQKSLAIRETLGEKASIAATWSNIADAHLKLGRPAESLEYANRAAASAQQIGQPEIYMNARTAAGRAFDALQKPAQARQALLDAVAAAEQLRVRAAGGEEDQERSFEHLVEPYYALVGLLVRQGETAEALAYAERAKGRVLLDVLHGGRENVTKAMTADEVKQERALVANMVALNTQLARLRQQSSTDAALVSQLDAQLQQARRAYESFQTNLYAAHPQLRAQRGQSPPLKLAELAALVPDAATAIIEYVVTDEQVYLFVVTHGVAAPRLQVYTLNVRGTELAELAHTFRRRVAERDLAVKQPAARLYDLLVKPAERQLQGVRKLCIVPDGALWELPFQALHAGARGYLLEQYAVFYAPSLSVLREMSRRRAARTSAPRGGKLAGGASLFALGNPVLSGATVARVGATRDEPLSQLPSAEREVNALGQLYGRDRSRVLIGPQAREAAVKMEAGRYRVLHFATHALLDDRNPMYSRILLASEPDGSGEDGLLEAWEVMKLDLSAELTVLSACQTARGRVAPGEGIIGMSWALFVAGSPAAVVSQWEVDSERSAALMVEFHRNLLGQKPAGRRAPTKSEALRQAALKLLRGPYSHPAYWAGFILIGDER
jgi:CHAT domain-containing protein